MRVAFIYGSPVGVSCKEATQWLNGTEFHAENLVADVKYRLAVSALLKSQLRSKSPKSVNQSAKFTAELGGNTLVRVLSENRVSINDPKTGKTTMGTIENVVENESDPNYVRRNVLVKGAIIETDQGRVRVTSRPGKDGVINGVLIE